MFLSVKNTGKLSLAEIEISGITVIAGINNTGKSTVGRLLFCIFNSFYRIDQQIETERKNRIRYVFGAEDYGDSFGLAGLFGAEEFAEHIFNNRASYENQERMTEDLRSLYIQTDKSLEKHLSDDVLSSMSEKIMQILSISDEEIFIAVFRRRLQAEFSMQINNTKRPNMASEIVLKIKEREIRVSVSEDEHIRVDDRFSLDTEVIYMDDPFVLDDSRQVYHSGDHRSHLAYKLLATNDDSPVKNAINEILMSKRLEAILSKLDAVCRGEMASRRTLSGFSASYRESGSEMALDIKNVSTGLKTFLMMKTLLLNGSLVENGIIVLDEPEIHLHPEWQLVFAEIIVLLQKEFSMHILLTTHSHYFLEAIDVFSHKHGTSSKCKYYQAEDVEWDAIINEVSATESIYERYARPLQVLENERYRHESF